VPRGRRLGVRAAQLARAGFEATDDAVATAYGTVRGTVFADFPHPARPWAISSGYLRTWSSCACTYTALDLTAQLRERRCLDDAKVDSVSIAVPAILALAERVTVYEDPVITARGICLHVSTSTHDLGKRTPQPPDDPWTPPDDEAYVRAVLAKATALPGSPRPVAAPDVAALIATHAVQDLFGPVTAPRTGSVPSP